MFDLNLSGPIRNHYLRICSPYPLDSGQREYQRAKVLEVDATAGAAAEFGSDRVDSAFPY